MSESSRGIEPLEQRPTRPSDILELEPVRISKLRNAVGSWTEYLVLFLRMMAVLSLATGLYHWARICSIGAHPGPGAGFQSHTIAWQAATVFFAVIDLVAAVGLWLAAAWGAVVWLTSILSVVVIELFFPQVYGDRILVVCVAIALLGVYLWLAIAAARERPR